LREHPVDKVINELPRSELNAYVKTWFWELHNWVNESLNHPQFPYEQLAPTYRSVNMRTALKSLDIPMRRAIRVRSGQLISYNDFLRHVNTLLSIY
jgi:hypothetical protein